LQVDLVKVHFPKPIKLGRSSRWYKSEVEQWK
ncbi:helix-turn-helix transcriptional regulator, partial [Escherichia coli]